MNYIKLISILLLCPKLCQADTFILKDGTRLEGEVTGEMNGTVLLQTLYGSLTIHKSDIAEQLSAAAPITAAPQEQVTVSTAQPPLPAAAPVSTNTAQPPLQPPAQPEADVQFTFTTLLPKDGSRLLVYSESGVTIATETFDAAGAPVSLEGAIKNGTYLERYPDGSLKTVKTVLGGKVNGSLKAYYQSAKLQVETSYFDGAKEGDFKYFGEDGTLLMEATYQNNRLNGWKREYSPEGTLKAEAFYQDDRAVEPPKLTTEPAPAQEPESLVTGKTTKVARGEVLSFTLNNKYIGKVRLDKEFNIIKLEGKLPDGAVKMYSPDGKLNKELTFGQGELKTLRLYEEGGPLKAEYSFRDGKAVPVIHQSSDTLKP